LQAEQVVEHAGLGVEGLIGGRLAGLGRAPFVGAEHAEACEAELWFGFEGEAKVRFAFSDRLRPDAARAVADLRRRGLRVEILSGDVPGPVAGVAQALDIAQWRAGLTPEGKAAAIDALKADGAKVL